MAQDKKEEKKPFEIRLAKRFYEKGYTFDLVASALQKCIRRGEEKEALKFAYLFYASGFSKYLSRRLQTIIHEDIGLANKEALLLAGLLELRTNSKDFKTAFGADGFLPFVNLIVLACRNKKTRIADNLSFLVINEIDKEEKLPEIKEYYIDCHTTLGKEKHGIWEEGTKKQKQERMRKWFDEWAMIDKEDETIDIYKEESKKKQGYYG